MSPIDPLGPLLARIRTQASSLERNRAQPHPGSHSGTGAAGEQTAPELMDGVLVEVANLSADLPDRRRRAFRLFLEAVLAHELGVEDQNASTFQDLVERVLASMEGDGRLRHALEHAGDVLLEMATR